MIEKGFATDTIEYGGVMMKSRGMMIKLEVDQEGIILVFDKDGSSVIGQNPTECNGST